MSTPIKGKSSVTVAQVMSTLDRRLYTDKQWLFIQADLTELKRVCELSPFGLRFDVMAAQWRHETSGGTSQVFRRFLNNAGMKTRDGSTYFTFPGPKSAARGQAMHMKAYTDGEPAKGYEQYLGYAPRFELAVKLAGGGIKNVEDLGDGIWAEDPNYACKVLDHLAVIQRASSPTQPVPSTKRPYLLFLAGHRFTTGSIGGTPREIELTTAMANECSTRARKAGFVADWYQRDIDGDSDPDDTRGSLDTVSAGAARWLQQFPHAMLFDCHYNGPQSPLHIIHPDTRGLSTRIPYGTPDDDVPSRKPGPLTSVEMASKIIREIAKTSRLPLLGGSGLMDEDSTGVAHQFGARLATLAYSANLRNAYRYVIEFGGTNDTEVRTDDFTQRCAEGLINALVDVYG